jgi:hypothetical protein
MNPITLSVTRQGRPAQRDVTIQCGQSTEVFKTPQMSEKIDSVRSTSDVLRELEDEKRVRELWIHTVDVDIFEDSTPFHTALKQLREKNLFQAYGRNLKLILCPTTRVQFVSNILEAMAGLRLLDVSAMIDIRAASHILNHHKEKLERFKFVNLEIKTSAEPHEMRFDLFDTTLTRAFRRLTIRIENAGASEEARKRTLRRVNRDVHRRAKHWREQKGIDKNSVTIIIKINTNN